MPKKCIICNKEAAYSIKDSSESYCTECAEEHFGDISCLTKLEDASSEVIKENIEPVENKPEDPIA